MMEGNMLSINGECYYFDIDNIMEWCLSSSNNQVKETEINEGYDTNDDGDMQMITKVVRELKTNNSQDDTIRYDFVKIMILPFLNEFNKINDITTNFSRTILFNTLINKGFLVKISD